MNSCCKGKNIRNDVKRKYLTIHSRFYADTCLVKPLSKVVAELIKFKLALWL